MLNASTKPPIPLNLKISSILKPNKNDSSSLKIQKESIESLKRVDMKRISDTPIPNQNKRRELKDNTSNNIGKLIEQLKTKILLKAYVLMKRKLNKRNKIVILTKALKASTH